MQVNEDLRQQFVQHALQSEDDCYTTSN